MSIRRKDQCFSITWNGWVRKRESIRFKEVCFVFDTLSLDQMFDLIDQDNSGFIEYNEFLIAATDPKVLMNTENLTAVFNVFDKDGNGYISLDELQLVMRDADVGDEVVQELLQYADTDGDDRISKQEFLRMLSQD